MNLPRAAVSILKVIDQASWRTSLSRLCAALIPSIPGQLLVVQPSVQLDFSENRARKGNWSDRMLGVRQDAGSSTRGLPDRVFSDVELFDFQIQRRARNSEFDSRAIWSSNYSVAFRKSRLDKFLFIVVEVLWEKM